MVINSDEPETNDDSNGNSDDESSFRETDSDGENDSIILGDPPLKARLGEIKNKDSASKEGSHNGRSTTEVHESRNEESDIESSEASFTTQDENVNEARDDWCNDNENENKETSDTCSISHNDEEESQGVPSDGHMEDPCSESLEMNRLDILNSIELLEKKKERQAGGDNQFCEKLAEADCRFQNGKTLRIKDLEVLFQARGEECLRASGRDKKKKILAQWELVKELPVTWEPWTEADDKELEELMHNTANVVN